MNKDYEEYVERYMKTHNISKEEAESHLIVKEYKKYCESNEREPKIIL